MPTPHLQLITDISSISLDLTPEQRSLLTAGRQGKGKVGCGSLRSLLPPFPFPHTVVLLFFASVTWPDRLEMLPWGLGRDPACHGAPALLEAAFLPGQELFLSIGRAQHRQVESWGKGERKLQGLFLHVNSSSNGLVPFVSQEEAVLGLVNTAQLVVAAEY